MTTIVPLETRYAGRLFRSRLEARWAVFYDTIGVPWMYEPEGYRLQDDVCYLPDFYLPQHVNGGYPSGQVVSDGAHLFNHGWDNNYTWCVCSDCGRFGIEFDGRSARICRHKSAAVDDKEYTFDDPRLLRAYDAANAARFR